MEEIITNIPGLQGGRVQTVDTTDGVSALVLCGQIISDLTGRWNTNVAFFSGSSRSEGLMALVRTDSSMARLSLSVDQPAPASPSLHVLWENGLADLDARSSTTLQTDLWMN